MADENLIKTRREFRAAVLSILDDEFEIYKGFLEEYLRSLWSLINQHKAEGPSLLLFAQLFQQAFHEEPLPFDEAWLEFDRPLIWKIIDGEYVNIGFEDHKVVFLERNEVDFRILKYTILHLITDLFRMRDDLLRDPSRLYGAPSPTIGYWYNLDVYIFIERGTSGSGSYNGWLDEEAQVDWVDLAGILRVGQSLE
jgi:hypothetical protein